MANKTPSIAGEYIKMLLKRFPNAKKLTLAKKAYKEHPKLFTGVEHARGVISYHSGSMGESNRKRLKDKTLVKPLTYDTNPYGLPESQTVHKPKWKLPSSIKKVLLLSDLHIPYQDNGAITTALNYGKKEKIDAIFINGDLIDVYMLSFHEKDPRKRSIADELEDCRTFFKGLRKAFNGIPIYYIPGNHEVRLERYLRVKAPELLDVEEFKLDVLLRVGEHKIEYIPYSTKCYFGKLLVEHGDKMKGSGGVNPARTLYLRLKRHAICGHFHRTTEATEKVYDGDVYVTYSTGCLCELEPGYMEVNNHNHGFAIIEMDGEMFTVQNKKIVNGKVY